MVENINTKQKQPVFEWDDKLSVGLAEIDDQHKEIIKDLNEFYHHITGDSFNYESAYEILLKFKFFVEKHFECEENYMFYIDYPEIFEHKRLHEQMCDSIDDLLDKLNNEKAEINELLALINMWLSEHITIEDNKIVKFAETQPAVSQFAINDIIKPFDM